ncbi:MAG: CotH kinase family protein [Verrucomicrobiaceae bacterium]
MIRSFWVFLVLTSILPANPIITEFLASNSGILTDEDGDTSDWIEIHNPTTADIDLAGWHLTDDALNLVQWTFPATNLASGEHLIVFASGKDRAISGAELHTNFKLSADGEYLALVSPAPVVTSEFNFPSQVIDISYGLTASGTEITLVSQSSPARVLVPTLSDDQTIGTTWRGGIATFDDSSWQTGLLGVGFERTSGFQDEIGIDVEADAWGINSSVYLRIPIDGSIDPANIASLTLRMKYDDGFAAFLNGDYLDGANNPTPLLWNSFSTSGVSDAQALQFQDFDVSASIPSLMESGNTLAIHGLNQFSNSGDLLIRPELIASLTNPVPPVTGYFSLPTPGAPNPSTNTPTPVSPNAGKVIISVPSGIKSNAITVTLTPGTPGAEIHYTLDGSDPTAGDPLYSAPFSISNPSRLRARAFLPAKLPGTLALADYSFLDPSLQSYLSDVPIIVMDNFGAGDYPNKGRSNDGRDIVQRPRQANVISIFNPTANGQPFTNSPALESRSGCRVRGSSSSQFTRKPLSVEFWNEQDEDRSLSPFGFDSEADWVLNAPNPSFDRALIHNPVSFGFAEMIGAHTPGSKVVVVFQNTDGGTITSSDLAGVYIFSEKIERKRMGVDFDKLSDDGTSGGWMVNIDRMEAIPEGLPVTTTQPNFHAAGPNGILEIPDDQQNSGGSQSVDDISEFYHSYLNFNSPGGYEILPAQRSAVQATTRAMDAAVWSGNFTSQLDSESWARNFAVHNFAKNQDAHVLSTFIYQETPTSKIKMGPVWDFDRAYTWKGGPSDTPLWASDRDWYQGLFQDTDFKQTHQDVWQEARRTTATNASLQGLVDDSSAGLRSDQIAASGLNFSTWQSRISELRTWVVNRATYLDNQYEPLPTLSPESGFFVSNLSINMTPTSGGTVYYTTDGSDPRADGGGISTSALPHSSTLNISGRTIITARTRDGSRWSGPVTSSYYVEADIPQLVVSEINYHPGDPSPAEEALGFTNSDDFEFLEFTNIGTTSVNLTLLNLRGGIDFDFSTSAITNLGPGQQVLLVKNQTAFEARHGPGLPIAGIFSGSLNNAGDSLILEDPALNLVLQDFSYSDDAPWPLCADGDGYSLILKSPSLGPDHSIPSNWRCSSLHGGNPGTSDSLTPFTGNPLADNDHDGIDALLEHFLGTSDSTAGDTSDLIQISSTIASDSLTYPALQVTYAIGADDVIPTAEWSGDLLTWSSAPGDIIPVSETLNNNGTATLTWRSTLPTTAVRQFFRLKVSNQ